MEEINRALTTLSVNPLIGRARDEIVQGLRSLQVQQHVLYYRHDDDMVTVVRILHGKMEASSRVVRP